MPPQRRLRARSTGTHVVESPLKRRRLIGLASAPLVTVLAVGTGVATVGADRSERSDATAARATPSASASSATEASTRGRAPDSALDRTLGTSRSTARVPLVNNRVPRAKGKLWTTGDLKLRIEPRAKSAVAGLLAEDKRVPVTGRRTDGFAEVIVNRVPRWVTADYLSKKKEVDETPATGGTAGGAAGLSDQPCSDGSSIESGLQASAVKVYRAACAAFPELSSYGGQDGHGEHVNGQAIDFMVTSSSVGQRLADFLYAHRVELDLFDIIWSQRIWTSERSGEGFRSMSDRGSATANHFDHVHIMVH